jgi:predicted lipid-binding transport protein (Tim44 family)
MSEGIPYADIIILALVAGFILLRLRSILGQNQGSDFFTRAPQEKTLKEQPIVQLDKTPKIKPKDEPDTYLNGLGEGAVADGLKKIKDKDAQFSATEFLGGAKRAFEMVFDAFIKGDKDTLRMLLSDSLYGDFTQELEERTRSDNKPETTLVSILTSDITEASLAGNVAKVAIKFTSEQVQVVRDKDGKIVEGDPSELHHIEDHWVFERDTTSKSPNWKIIET